MAPCEDMASVVSELGAHLSATKFSLTSEQEASSSLRRELARAKREVAVTRASMPGKPKRQQGLRKWVLSHGVVLWGRSGGGSHTHVRGAARSV